MYDLHPPPHLLSCFRWRKSYFSFMRMDGSFPCLGEQQLKKVGYVTSCFLSSALDSSSRLTPSPLTSSYSNDNSSASQLGGSHQLLNNLDFGHGMSLMVSVRKTFPSNIPPHFHPSPTLYLQCSKPATTFASSTSHQKPSSISKHNHLPDHSYCSITGQTS